MMSYDFAFEFSSSSIIPDKYSSFFCLLLFIFFGGFRSFYMKKTKISFRSLVLLMSLYLIFSHYA